MKKGQFFLQSLLIVSVITLWLGAGFRTISAQEGTGVKIQPALIEERIDPGQVLSSSLEVTNLSRESETYYAIKRDVSGVADNGSPIFAEVGEKTGFELSEWIKISEDPITIVAGGTKAIPFTITVPENASPGGHFGGIFMYLEPVAPGETGTGVGYQVGTLISLRISGEVVEDARIREFRTESKVYGKPSVNFVARIENLGNTLIRPRGPLEITNFFGENVATLKMNDSGGAVLPEQVREFTLSWEGEGFHFGRYQALMGLVYGEDSVKSISDTYSFWILPVNVILPVILGIALLVLAIYLLMRYYVRKKLGQMIDSSGRLSKTADRAAHLQKSSFKHFIFLTVSISLLALIILGLLFFLFA